ncbi:lys-63-specific deubiquitinase BRCC36 [Copidosoma floridanum]|uniref:lys-63-specific deubiquitinase BRCC36 n=1 Tax=Copidosoma floridanum TaxID=29053 RepID=UPI0006C9815F|nr:lys-63-specific deubiquitinase BRCC36 [Copidosoma floridanum]XP_014211488.1 lys-63-specific deubiquitinase BRCC36 [Copidosoma floridanum]
MHLKKVCLQADVYMVCLQHALSTENFEVMGLLIGDNAEGVTTISAAIILRRSDKKKDRVEISPDQLLKATNEAERLTEELHKRVRVVGWYHSHPHITVCPSHVDVGTQAMYQIMDSSFVGLIFSVFSEDKGSKEQEVSLTCFQSDDGKSKEIPLVIKPTKDISTNCLKTMTELPKILAQEEEEMAEGTRNHPDLLVSIHNNAVQTRALGHVTDIITRPLVQTFYGRYESNLTKIDYLHKQIQHLERELQNQ